MPSRKDESAEENALLAYQLSAELAMWVFTDEYKSASFRKTQETLSHRSLPTGLITSFCRPVQIILSRGYVSLA